MKSNTELGTPEIHQRHSVMIEGGTVPRAKVMDGTVVDRYLMDGLINLQQHMACEYLLERAVKAGVYTRGIDNTMPSCFSAHTSRVPTGIEPYRKLIRALIKKFGESQAKLVDRVVLENWDVSGCQDKMTLLTGALDFIVDSRMGGSRNTLRHRKRYTKD